VLWNHDSNIVLAGVKHSYSFAGVTVEEERSCLFGLKCAHKVSAIIKGDCINPNAQVSTDFRKFY